MLVCLRPLECTSWQNGAGLTLYPWLIPLINWGLGALQVKRTVVELTGSACTFPGGTVGTDPEEGERKKRQRGWEKKKTERARWDRRRKRTWKCTTGTFSPAWFTVWESGWSFLFFWGGSFGEVRTCQSNRVWERSPQAASRWTLQQFVWCEQATLMLHRKKKTTAEEGER